MSRTRIWNNGGGVQSAAIAALIVQGRIPKPDLAVIADTERERSTTWHYLERFVAPALASVGVQMHRIAKSDWCNVDYLGGKDKDTILIPAFTTKNGEIGKLETYCSAEWKRDAVRRWATKVHEVGPSTNLIGFSIDEVARAVRAMNAKKNQGKWQVEFPLIDLGMNRGDCVALVERMGWPTPPRSSCWMCPNHHMQEWREIRAHPVDWPKVVAFEREIRKHDPDVWLTDQAVPIDQASFGDEQEVLFGLDRGACNSGMCFV